MRKIISLLLVLFLSGVMVACSKDPASSIDTGDKTSVASTAVAGTSSDTATSDATQSTRETLSTAQSSSSTGAASTQPLPPVTLEISEDTSPIYRNPGKGFVFYGLPDTLDADDVAKGNLIYARLDWVTLEPQEGQYQWWILENYIRQARNHDIKFAFGVMNASTDFCPADGCSTPQWVFDAGARYYEVTDNRGVVNKVPYWRDNAVFHQKLQNFIEALADRYNGHPDIAFIDIRSYGNWGEFHTGGIGTSDKGEEIGYLSNDEVFDLYIKPYIDAFPDTQLMLPFGMQAHKDAYEKAVACGVGMRRDGIPDWSDGSDIAFAAGKVMTVTEYTDTLEALLKKGVWDDDKVFDALMRAKVSYTEIGRGTGYGTNLNFIKEREELMRRLANKIGYHFVLEQVTLPLAVDEKQLFSVMMKWTNKGVTSLFNEPCHMAVGLLNDQDKIVDICWMDNVDPAAWTPGTHTENAAVLFQKAESGTYRLAVGLFEDKQNTKPDYQIGNHGKVNGWYVFSETFHIG